MYIHLCISIHLCKIKKNKKLLFSLEKVLFLLNDPNDGFNTIGQMNNPLKQIKLWRLSILYTHI